VITLFGANASPCTKSDLSGSRGRGGATSNLSGGNDLDKGTAYGKLLSHRDFDGVLSQC
jgi:hypothetical protein